MIRCVSIFVLMTCFFAPHLVRACYESSLSESIWMIFSNPFFILILFIPFGFLLVFRLVRKKYLSAVKLQRRLKIATLVAFLPLLCFVIFFAYIALNSLFHPTPPTPSSPYMYPLC